MINIVVKFNIIYSLFRYLQNAFQKIFKAFIELTLIYLVEVKLMEQQIAVWGVQVPKKLDDTLVTAIKNSTFANKSDFIRDAVRRRLEEWAS